ncbi:MAG: hypothetical protein ABEK50_12180 [bacterium]
MDRFGHFLIDPPLNPALNMAADWQLLKSTNKPTIRFYRWDQPVISIGYRQQTDPPQAILELAEEYPIVVRPTGGGYLYHHRDLSYSILLPETHPLTDQSILESYGVIRTIFGRSLQQLNLLDEQETGTGTAPSDNCLESAAGHEPVKDGAKWMAASQLRHRGRLLQHGSLFWKDPDWPDELASNEPSHLRDPTTDITLKQVREKLTKAFAEEIVGENGLKLINRSKQDWDRLLSQVIQFEVADIGQLPTFDRFN